MYPIETMAIVAAQRIAEANSVEFDQALETTVLS